MLLFNKKCLEQLTDYRTQVHVTRIEQGVGCWHIQLADGATLKTKLLIGAMAPIHLYVSKPLLI